MYLKKTERKKRHLLQGVVQTKLRNVGKWRGDQKCSEISLRLLQNVPNSLMSDFSCYNEVFVILLFR